MISKFDFICEIDRGFYSGAGFFAYCDGYMEKKFIANCTNY